MFKTLITLVLLSASAFVFAAEAPKAEPTTDVKKVEEAKTTEADKASK